MISHTATGWVYYFNNRLEEAATLLQKALELDPTFLQAHYWLGLSHAGLGRADGALAEFNRCVEIGGRNPQTLTGLAYGHAMAGRRDEARAILREIEGMARERYVSPYYRAQVLAGLGDKEAAVSALSDALEERAHWLTFMHMDPVMDPLRGEPRFQEIVRKVGVPV